MKTRQFMIILTTLFMTAACSSGVGTSSTDDDQGSNSQNMTTEATYRITFTNQWNATDHLAFPGNAHFSPIVAISHDMSYGFFEIDGLASAALEPLAELGQTGLILQEVVAAQNSGFVKDSFQGSNFFPNSVGESISFEISASVNHPYLSLVSMIAPSPDWIVAVESLTLFDGKDFIDDIEMNLYAINAGTEAGDIGGNFSINNPPSNPQRPISFLAKRVGLMAPFAAVKITRVK